VQCDDLVFNFEGGVPSSHSTCTLFVIRNQLCVEEYPAFPIIILVIIYVESMNRRKFIGSTIAIAAIAGCTDNGPETTGEDDTSSENSSGDNSDGSTNRSEDSEEEIDDVTEDDDAVYENYYSVTIEESTESPDPEREVSEFEELNQDAQDEFTEIIESSEYEEDGEATITQDESLALIEEKRRPGYIKFEEEYYPTSFAVA